jgi:hypothetical protein
MLSSAPRSSAGRLNGSPRSQKKFRARRIGRLLSSAFRKFAVAIRNSAQGPALPFTGARRTAAVQRKPSYAVSRPATQIGHLQSFASVCYRAASCPALRRVSRSDTSRSDLRRRHSSTLGQYRDSPPLRSGPDLRSNLSVQSHSRSSAIVLLPRNSHSYLRPLRSDAALAALRRKRHGRPKSRVKPDGGGVDSRHRPWANVPQTPRARVALDVLGREGARVVRARPSPQKGSVARSEPTHTASRVGLRAGWLMY